MRFLLSAATIYLLTLNAVNISLSVTLAKSRQDANRDDKYRISSVYDVGSDTSYISLLYRQGEKWFTLWKRKTPLRMSPDYSYLISKNGDRVIVINKASHDEIPSEGICAFGEEGRLLGAWTMTQLIPESECNRLLASRALSFIPRWKPICFLTQSDRYFVLASPFGSYRIVDLTTGKIVRVSARRKKGLFQAKIDCFRHILMEQRMNVLSDAINGIVTLQDKESYPLLEKIVKSKRIFRPDIWARYKAMQAALHLCGDKALPLFKSSYAAMNEPDATYWLSTLIEGDGRDIERHIRLWKRRADKHFADTLTLLQAERAVYRHP